MYYWSHSVAMATPFDLSPGKLNTEHWPPNKREKKEGDNVLERTESIGRAIK